jgi:hypothetical protein
MALKIQGLRYIIYMVKTKNLIIEKKKLLAVFPALNYYTASFIIIFR